MNRYMLVGVFTLIAVGTSASAHSPLTGPYLTKSLGEARPGASYAICHVRAGSTRVLRVRGGRELPPVLTGNGLRANALAQLVASAKNEPFRRTGMHVTATVPPLKITAGDAPSIADYPLLVDSSDIKSRVGLASSRLRSLVEQQCRNLSVPRATASAPSANEESSEAADGTEF